MQIQKLFKKQDERYVRLNVHTNISVSLCCHGFLMILLAFLIIDQNVKVDELRDGTANMKVDVRSVFDAVETLVRKFSNCINVHQFVLL